MQLFYPRCTQTGVLCGRLRKDMSNMNVLLGSFQV